jgi:hypothetical protein
MDFPIPRLAPVIMAILLSRRKKFVVLGTRLNLLLSRMFAAYWSSQIRNGYRHITSQLRASARSSKSKRGLALVFNGILISLF